MNQCLYYSEVQISRLLITTNNKCNQEIKVKIKEDQNLHIQFKTKTRKTKKMRDSIIVMITKQ